MSGTSDTTIDEALKVFISYSRAQVHFADELELALQDKGFSVLIDRHSIAKGEDFKSRLGEMILQCDTIVFILSDESASSDVCAWEVEEARRLTKRILVITLSDLSPGIKAPRDLAGIDWIHCWRNPKIPGSSQTRGFIELDHALRTDIGWLREKTALQEDADRWASRGAQVDSPLLLQGELLSDAKAWVRESPNQEVVPDSVSRFITASEQAEADRAARAAANLEEREAALQARERAESALELARQKDAERATRDARRIRQTGFIGAVIAGVLLVASLFTGWWGWENRQDSIQQRAYVEVLSADVQKRSSDTLAAESVSIFESESGDHTASMLMALQADPAAQKTEVRRRFNGETGFESALGALQAAYNANKLEKILDFNEKEPRQVLWSPNGKVIALLFEDAELNLWDVDKESLSSIVVHSESWVRSIAWSPDGYTLAIGHADGVIGFWNTLKATSDGHAQHNGASVELLAWSPNGNRIASASWDGTIHIWDSIEREQKLELSGEPQNLTALNWLSNAPYIATASRAGTIQLWDVDRGVLLDQKSHDSVSIRSLEWSPLKKKLVSVNVLGSLEFWTISDGSMVRDSSQSTSDRSSDAAAWSNEDINYAAWSSDGRHLALTRGSKLEIWETWLAYGEPDLRGVYEHVEPISLMTWSPSRSHIVTASNGGSVKIWKTRALTPSHTIEGEGPASWSPIGEHIATKNRSAINLWQGESYIWQSALDGSAKAGHFAWSSDGTRVAAIIDESLIKVWDVVSGTVIAELAGTDAQIETLAWSPDDAFIASVAENVTIWSASEYVVLKEIDARFFFPETISWSPDATQLIISSGFLGLALLDMQSEQVLNFFSTNDDLEVDLAVWSPDGDLIASTYGENEIALWHVPTRSLVAVLRGHLNKIRHLAWSPDGNRVASVADDNALLIWDVHARVRLATLHAFDDALVSVAWSPDGRRVIGATWTDRAHIWELPEMLSMPPVEQVRAACQNLTDIGAKLSHSARDLEVFPALKDELRYSEQDIDSLDDPEQLVLQSPCEGQIE